MISCANSLMSLPPGARPGGEPGPLRNGNPCGDPNSAPRGGRGTGPHTAEGMARLHYPPLR